MSTLTSADFGELKRPTTRVHAPPGGGSSWSFGGDEAPAAAPSRAAAGKKRFEDVSMSSPRASAAPPAPVAAPVAAPAAAASVSPVAAPGTIRVALVKTTSDAEVVDLMLQNCWDRLQQTAGVTAESFAVSTLDELPYAANKLAQFGGFDAVICFGFLNALDPLFQVLAAALTQALIDISVRNVKPIVRAVFIGEPRVASVKAKGGWGADFADSIAGLAKLGGFVGPIATHAEGHGVTKHIDISRGNVLPARLLGAPQGVIHSVDKLRDSLYQHGAR